MDDLLESNETYIATQLSYQPSIDGLRALAVLAVVLYHANVLGMRAGYLGVDIFFVISGFLISRIIIAEFVASRFTLVGFYERRVRRIIPALFLMVATTIAVDWYVLMPLDYKRLVQSAAATGLFASNIFFGDNNKEVISIRPPPNSPCCTPGRSGSRSNFIFCFRF